MSDEDLSKKIETYQQLAKENPNVDVNMLLMNALATEDSHRSVGKSYKWAYTISAGLPPLGLFFAFKYWFSDDESDKTAAKICILLTVISGIIFIISTKALLSGSGASLQQIQQITPKDIYQAGQ